MKKIDLQSIDIQKLSDIKVKRKIDFQILWKHGKQACEKHWMMHRENIKKILAQFDSFQGTVFFIYVCIFFGVIISIFFTIPVLSHIFTIQKDIASAKYNVGVLQEDLSSLKNVELELKNIRKDIVKMQKMAPEKPQEENMIVTLGTLIAGNYLVSPNRIAWNQEKENMIDNERIRSTFDVYSYSFTTQGSYENIQSFMKMLRENLRIIDVKSIKMVPLADGNIEVAFLVWAYNLKTQNAEEEMRELE